MTAFGTRALVLELATAAVPGTFVDFTSAISKCVLRSAESDSDFVTFAEAAGGGARDYVMVVTAAQDSATTALWYKAWAETGTDAPYRVWPNGKPSGGTPSATQPRFNGLVTISEPDGDFIGGEADKSNTAKFTTEFEWACTAKPTLAIS